MCVFVCLFVLKSLPLYVLLHLLNIIGMSDIMRRRDQGTYCWWESRISTGTKTGSCGESWKGTAAVLWSHFLCKYFIYPVRPKYIIPSCSLVFAGAFLLETKLSLQIFWIPPFFPLSFCLLTNILAKFSNWTCFWPHYTLQHLHPSVLLSNLSIPHPTHSLPCQVWSPWLII